MNGQSVHVNAIVHAGDTVSVVLSERTPREDLYCANAAKPDIVYEDDDLLLVNKPAGMVVHPGHGNYSATLVNALTYYLQNLPLFQEGDMRAGLVHRIDKDTSGLLVIAKTPDAKTNLGNQFFNKTTNAVTRRWSGEMWNRMKGPLSAISAVIPETACR